LEKYEVAQAETVLLKGLGLGERDGARDLGARLALIELSCGPIVMRAQNVWFFGGRCGNNNELKIKIKTHPDFFSLLFYFNLSCYCRTLHVLRRGTKRKRKALV